MTFTDSSTEVFYHTGTRATRVAAEFRDPQEPNRSKVYTAVVRKDRPGQAVEGHRISTRAANLQAVESESGRGRELAGFQRLYVQSGGVRSRIAGG
jgi:hypothetical protein